MHDSLYIPYLVCWGSVSDTHPTRTQHSRVPAARVMQHVTSAASRSAYDPTSCVEPHIIHSRISTVKMEFCRDKMDPLASSEWPKRTDMLQEQTITKRLSKRRI